MVLHHSGQNVFCFWVVVVVVVCDPELTSWLGICVARAHLIESCQPNISFALRRLGW